MKENKIKYRKQEKYSSCRLIAAINAKIFLGGDDVDEETFEKLVDISKCRYGAVISIKKVYPLLGLSFKDGPLHGKKDEHWIGTWNDSTLEWIAQNLPVEISTIETSLGYHASLIVEVKNKKVKMINHVKDWWLWSDIIENHISEWCHHNKLRSFSINAEK